MHERNFMKRFYLAMLFSILAASSALADVSDTVLNPEIHYTLPSGAVFNVPKGWMVQPKNGSFILHDPEQKITLVLAEVEDVDGQDAIKDAWKDYNPDFSSLVVKVLHYQKSDEWEEKYRVWYFVPDPSVGLYKASQTRGLYAFSYKKDRRWYVALMDYDLVAADKRQAQTEIILGSLELNNKGGKPTPTPAANPVD